MFILILVIILIFLMIMTDWVMIIVTVIVIAFVETNIYSIASKVADIEILYSLNLKLNLISGFSSPMRSGYQFLFQFITNSLTSGVN